jgi:hypothetical protein
VRSFFDYGRFTKIHRRETDAKEFLTMAPSSRNATFSGVEIAWILNKA